jgi:hypothetical protein
VQRQMTNRLAVAAGLTPEARGGRHLGPARPTGGPPAAEHGSRADARSAVRTHAAGAMHQDQAITDRQVAAHQTILRAAGSVRTDSSSLHSSSLNYDALACASPHTHARAALTAAAESRLHLPPNKALTV